MKTVRNDPYDIKVRCARLGITAKDLANKVAEVRGSCSLAFLSRAMSSECKTDGETEVLQIADGIMRGMEKNGFAFKKTET